LGRVTQTGQTLLVQTINLLESFFSSKLEPGFYDDGTMSKTSKIVFRDATGLAKAFANLNMISLDGRGRHEFRGIVKTSDGLNGGLQGHIG
jgi:3-mercaptopyruvate sulfurtransferase SseA